MRPSAGVTLKLNKSDGTLKIKGKNHLLWFKENFEHILDSGGKEFEALKELAKLVDDELKLNDGNTVCVLTFIYCFLMFCLIVALFNMW